jgi:hypothetical protein
MTEPLLNCDEPYWRHLGNAVIGVLPAVERVDEFIGALRATGREVGNVRILRGDDGLKILDSTGRSHGLLARFARVIESLGYDQETFSLFNEGLNKGESVVAVPASPNDCRHIGELIVHHNGHAVFYFGYSSAISLTGP